MTAKILIADDFHPLLMEKLAEANIPYSYQPNLDRLGILEQLKQGATCLVLRSKIIVDQEVLAAGTGLQMIARGGAGMDNVDEAAAQALQIECVNAGEANSDAVGEHTIGMLLGLLHRIAKSDAEVRKGIWDREGNRGVELAGKTVGIVGFGNTGSAVAKKLLGFDVRILAYDKYLSGFGNEHIQEASMQEIFQHADILTIHVPLDGHTKHMVNSDFLQQFVRKIYLLNLSRGAVVNTSDVVKFLQNGKILGFAADVLENENPSQMKDSDMAWFQNLIQRPNVVLSPHVAGWSTESYIKISTVLAAKIIGRFAPL